MHGSASYPALSLSPHILGINWIDSWVLGPHDHIRTRDKPGVCKHYLPAAHTSSVAQHRLNALQQRGQCKHRLASHHLLSKVLHVLEVNTALATKPAGHTQHGVV